MFSSTIWMSFKEPQTVADEFYVRTLFQQAGLRCFCRQSKRRCISINFTSQQQIKHTCLYKFLRMLHSLGFNFRSFLAESFPSMVGWFCAWRPYNKSSLAEDMLQSTSEVRKAAKMPTQSGRWKNCRHQKIPPPHRPERQDRSSLLRKATARAATGAKIILSFGTFFQYRKESIRRRRGDGIEAKSILSIFFLLFSLFAPMLVRYVFRRSHSLLGRLPKSIFYL